MVHGKKHELTHLNNSWDISNFFLLQVTGYMYMQCGRVEVRPSNDLQEGLRLKESKGRWMFPPEAADPQALTRAWC